MNPNQQSNIPPMISNKEIPRSPPPPTYQSIPLNYPIIDPAYNPAKLNTVEPALNPQYYLQVVNPNMTAPIPIFPYQPSSSDMQAPENLMLSGYNKLLNMKGIILKQKLEVLELFTGYETENSYNIYELDFNGKRSQLPFLKAKEKSSCLSRNCLSANCRPFNMKVIQKNKANKELNDQPFLLLKREFNCTFWCFNRPQMLIYNIESGNNKILIGKIINPFLCCSRGVDVYDEHERILYVIRSNCCQLGICCPLPCDVCQTIKFEVFDINGSHIANLSKKSPGCLMACCSDVTNFELKFPVNASGKERALLLATLIMLDFSYFEVRNHNDDE